MRPGDPRGGGEPHAADRADRRAGRWRAGRGEALDLEVGYADVAADLRAEIVAEAHDYFVEQVIGMGEVSAIKGRRSSSRGSSTTA